MRQIKILLLILMVFAAKATAQAVHPIQLIREDQSLLGPPAYEAAKEFKTESAAIRAIFFDTKPYQGKLTKTFAYLGVPAHEAGQKLPAMVLIHGGGGTAFYRWGKVLNDRGYAAIAMDLCGCLPVREGDKKG